MKRLIHTLLLSLSFTPLVSKADEYGVLEPELTQKVRYRYISEILTVEAGEVFTPLLSLGSGSGYRQLVAYEYSANPLTDPSSSAFGDVTDEGYLYQNDEVGEISQPIYGPIKLVILYNPPTNQSPSESKRDSGYVQYRISNLNPSDEYGVLEPELTQKVRYRYISEILTVEAGEVFTPLLSLGSGSGYRQLVAYEYSANPLTDPSSSAFGDVTDEGYLYQNDEVGEISQPIYGPIKLVILYNPPTNQSPSESKRDSGYVQYRISSQNEQLTLPILSEQVNENTEGVATNTAEIEAIKAQLATLVDALAAKDAQIEQQTLRIAEVEAQRDARPTQAQLATVEAERDAKFTEAQIRAMSADPTAGLNDEGNVQVDISFIHSSDLVNFQPFTLTPEMMSVADGKLRMQFPPMDQEAFFYRLGLE